MSCKMCWRGSTRPIKRSFAASRRGEKAGFPRFQGRDRYHSFTYKEFGNGATLDNGFLVLSKIGRIAVRWSRPLEGTPKTVTISPGSGWLVCLLLLRRCAGTAIAARLGRKPALTWGWRPSPRSPMAHASSQPGCYRKAERALKTAQRRVVAPQEGEQPPAQGGEAAGQGASDGKPPAAGLSPQDGARSWSATTTRSIMRTCRRPTCSRITTSPRASGCGWSAVLEHPRFQGSMRREASRSGAACLHQPDVFWLWRRGQERLIRPLALLPGLWNEPASGPQRGEEHRAGRAGPSGRRGVGRVGEPRIHRALARVECQFSSSVRHASPCHHAHRLRMGTRPPASLPIGSKSVRPRLRPLLDAIFYVVGAGHAWR